MIRCRDVPLDSRRQAFSSWNLLPLALDPGSWYFPYSVVSRLLFAGIAVYGFVISLGGQVVFKGPVLD